MPNLRLSHTSQPRRLGGMTTPTPTVAVLGLGRMGTAMTTRLRDRGWTVNGWTRSSGTEVGPVVSDADIVLLALFDGPACDQMLAECAPYLSADQVVVNTTTVAPAEAVTHEKAVQASGAGYLHAPVMMGPPAARNARGVMLVSGPLERFNRVRDELARMTGHLMYTGERPDMAAVLKLCGNAVVLSMVGIMADVFHMADAARVERSDVIRLFDHVSAQGVITSRGEKMVEGDFAPLFTLTVARKDLRLMQETAGIAEVPILDALAAHMDRMILAGHGGEDVAVLGVKE